MRSFFLYTFLQLVSIATTSVATAHRWEANDVSILIPLPRNVAEIGSMIRLTDSGSKGPLMPLTVFQQFRPNKLAPDDFQDTHLYPNYSLLSLRVDPCSGSTCRNEFRLVFQAVETRPKIHVVDEAFHLTYLVTEADMTSLLADLWQFKQASPVDTSDIALGPHPGLTTTGIISPYFEQLRAIILRYVGGENLFRVTTTNIQLGRAFPGAPMSFFWNFKSLVRIAEGFYAPEEIPTFHQLEQTISVQGINALQLTPSQPVPIPEELVLTFNPFFPTGEDTIVPFLRPAAEVVAMAEGDVQRVTDAAFRIENPLLHNFSNTDCISCHIAAKSREFAGKLRGPLPASNDKYFSPDGNDRVEHNAFPDDFRVLRAFSYASVKGDSETRPSIIPRTVFETAEVVRRLNSKSSVNLTHPKDAVWVAQYGPK